VCGNQIQKLPEFLYQFRNQTGNSVMFVQMTTAMPPQPGDTEPKFNPTPVCLNCVQGIIGKFITASGQENAETITQ